MAKAGLHLIVKCVICEKPFRQSRSDQQYCSRSCFYLAWKERKPKLQRACKTCGSIIIHPTMEYCRNPCTSELARSVKRKLQNSGIGKGWSKGMQFVNKSPNYICLCCSKPFYAIVSPSYKSRGGGKFCSNECRTKAIAMNPKNYPQTVNKRSKIGKRPDLNNQFFRSAWEANYARYLNFLIKTKEIIKWEFEVDTFEFEGIKRGTRFYTPDFKIFKTDSNVEYHEIKGYMDARSATKLKRMKKYHPAIRIVLIDKVGYASIAKVACKLVSGWEGNYGCK